MFAEITSLALPVFIPWCLDAPVPVGSQSSVCPKMGLTDAAGLDWLSAEGWAFLPVLPEGWWVSAIQQWPQGVSPLPSRALKYFIEGLCRREHAAAVTSSIYSFSMESLSTPGLMWHEAELLTSALCWRRSNWREGAFLISIPWVIRDWAMWREDLLMLQRGGELGNEVTGRLAGISVWLCLVLVSVSSHLSMCDTSEPYARHKTVLQGCLPSPKEWAALQSCHDKQVLQPLQQEAVLPFLLQSLLPLNLDCSVVMQVKICYARLCAWGVQCRVPYNELLTE